MRGSGERTARVESQVWHWVAQVPGMMVARVCCSVLISVAVWAWASEVKAARATTADARRSMLGGEGKEGGDAV